MDFEVKVWRNIYDQVQILGQYIVDSLPDAYGNPPKFEITEVERKKAERELEILLKNNDRYLDKCHLRPKDPIWNYDRFNQTTWSSSEKFAYREKVCRKKYMTVRF